MADTSTLKYVIDGYDLQYMVIHVSFPDDGFKVNIGVTTFPTTQAELDDLVAPFGKHVEQIATASTAPTAEFLQSVLGKETTTDRYSSVAALAAMQANSQASIDAQSNELVVADNTTLGQASSNNTSADLTYIKQLIAEALAEQTATAATTDTTSTTAS